MKHKRGPLRAGLVAAAPRTFGVKAGFKFN